METSVNNKCKAFTSMEQSKVLAEILPLESADMAYYFMKGSGHLVNPSPFVLDGTEVREDGMFTYLNCWSLAALLDVLPYSSLHKTFSGWRCDSYNKEGKTCKLGENAGDPIAACCKMIIKLHELSNYDTISKI